MHTPVDHHHMAFIASIWPTAIVMTTYLVFVLKLGPKMMAHRKAFELRGIIKVYNIVQILYNIVTFIYFTHFMFILRPYSLRCMVSLPLDHEHKDRERFITYLYLSNKFMDLLDTVFFVLRKKNRQISFLHVFHHVALVTFSYAIPRFYGAGGSPLLMAFLNQIVHAIMYTYYLLSSISPAAQASLWWKKYITMFQLIQFALIFLQCIDMLLQPNCEAPRTVAYVFAAFSVALAVMFSKFYFKTYIRPNRRKSGRS
ncbi:elongation of very long chain fatty acids protein F-like [Drosophila serrata]|uniref:elongation of very long chain fatty acids protein F-like n=1 Tax=Drosophila serrata TaxID=7274 RepID=UPI000A1D29ED|nr:elongation of very long chain fatty acids protein F-like [Drosophila serrata]